MNGHGERMWIRGKPVRGFAGGLLLGLGVALLGHQLEAWVLELKSVIILPLAFAVVGAIRAWVGRAYDVTTERTEPVPPPAAEA